MGTDSYGEDATAAVDARSYGELQARLRAMSYTDVRCRCFSPCFFFVWSMRVLLLLLC